MEILNEFLIIDGRKHPFVFGEKSKSLSSEKEVSLIFTPTDELVVPTDRFNPNLSELTFTPI